jgi:tight adherence protein C
MFLASPYVIAIIVAVIVFAGYIGFDVMFSRKQQVSRLQAYASNTGDYGDGGDDLVSLEQSPTAMTGFMMTMLKMVGVDIDEGLDKFRKTCQHAGITSYHAPLYLLFFKRLGGLFFAVIGGIIILSSLRAQGLGAAQNILVGLILVVIGVYGVDLYLKNTIIKRQKVLTRSMPDTLDLMVVCVESGLALDAALNRVCKELGRAHPEITKELNQTRMELALLNDRSQALMNLAERTNIVAFRSLVAALIQTEKFGTSLTDTLRVLSEDYRLTRLMLAEEKAGKLPVMMTIPLILLLMPAFVLVILGPAYVKLKAQGGLFGKDAPEAP